MLPISNRIRILIDYKKYVGEHQKEFTEVIPLYKQEALEEARKEAQAEYQEKLNTKVAEMQEIVDKNIA